MIASWFTHNGYLNTAMSINQSFVQLFGSSAAFYLLPRFHSIDSVQWFTVAIGVFSLLCNVLYVYLQLINSSYLDQLKLIGSGSESGLCRPPVDSSSSSSVVPIVTIGQDRGSDNNNNNNNERSPLLPESKIHTNTSTNELRVSHFSSSFWLLFLHTSCMSPILYTFTAFGPLYLQDNFATLQSSESAGDGISLLYLGIAFAPLSGFLIDRIGYRVVIQLVANLLILFLFVALKYMSSINPYYALFAVGLCFSVTEANSLAMVSYVVPSEKLGEAYGITACGVSIALLFEPALVGYLRDVTGSFEASIWLFLFLILAGASFCVALIYGSNTTLTDRVIYS